MRNASSNAPGGISGSRGATPGAPGVTGLAVWVGVGVTAGFVVTVGVGVTVGVVVTVGVGVVVGVCAESGCRTTPATASASSHPHADLAVCDRPSATKVSGMVSASQ